MNYKFLKNRIFLFSILINSGLFLLTYLLFIPEFNTNDDVGMMLRVSGITEYSEASQYMLFSNVIIGYILKFLYSLNQNFIWYEVYIVLTLFIAHAVFLYIALKNTSSKKKVLVFYLLYFILVGSTLLLKIQFTLEATFLILSGLSLIFLPINKKELDYKELFFGLILIVIGSMIRIMALPMAILFFLPIIAYSFIKKVRSKQFKVFLKSFLFISIAIGLSYGLQKYNTYIYSKSGHPENQFYEYNNLRGQIKDYQLLEKYTDDEAENILNSVKWSENDYDMFMNWFYVDVERYDISKLRNIVNNNFEKKVIKTKILDFSLSKFLSIFSIAENYFILTYLLLFFALIKMKKKHNILILMYIIYCILLLIYIYIKFKFPSFRIYFSLFAFISILPVLLVSEQDFRLRSFSDYKKKEFYEIIKNIFSVSLIILLLYSVIINIHYRLSDSVRVKSDNKSYYENIDYLSKEDKIFVNQGAKIGWRKMPFFQSKKYLKDLSIIGLGVSIHTSSNYYKLEKLGIKDLYVDMLRRDDIFYLADNHEVNYYSLYMKEHYNLNVGSPVVSYNNELQVRKVIDLDSIPLLDSINIIFDNKMNDFESGIADGCKGYGSETFFLRDSDDYYSEPYSQKITYNHKSKYPGLNINKLEIGNSYYIEMWIKSKSNVKIKVMAGLKSFIFKKIKKGEWTKIYCVLKSESNFLKILSVNNVGSNEILIDDIIICKLELGAK